MSAIPWSARRTSRYRRRVLRDLPMPKSMPASDLGVSPTTQKASSGRTTAYTNYAIPPPASET
jgi:hypothetical protein